MKPRNRVMNWLGRNAPALNAVPPSAMAWALAAPAKRERALQREMARTPDADQAGLRLRHRAGSLVSLPPRPWSAQVPRSH
jgi:hypothetical protein